MLTDEQRQRVAGSLGLARWAASRCGPLTDDNVAIAYLALCRAAQTYRPGRGMTWESYARQRVRGDLLDAWKLAGGYRRKRVADPVVTAATCHDDYAEADDAMYARWLFDAFDDRAQRMVRRWCAGETKADIATAEGISGARVGQIIDARIRQLAELCDEATTH
jgi:Sigma-70 region 2